MKNNHNFIKLRAVRLFMHGECFVGKPADIRTIDPKANSLEFNTQCATDFATGDYLQAQCLYIKSLLSKG